MAAAGELGSECGGIGNLYNFMRKIHFADSLEESVARALEMGGISFTHESENKDQGLDFYLPDYNVYIEVKQFHADRISKQLASQDNVIVLQGRKAVALFSTFFQTII
jgi:hypothetical protein